MGGGGGEWGIINRSGWKMWEQLPERGNESKWEETWKENGRKMWRKYPFFTFPEVQSRGGDYNRS